MYEKTAQAYAAYDAGSWHGGCADVQLLMNSASGVPWLWCPSCRCTAQIDVVAGHIVPSSSADAREVIE